MMRSRLALAILGVLCLFVVAELTHAQQQPFGVGQQFGGQQGQGNQQGGQQNQGGIPGLQGGSAQADFESLIDLITSTVEVDSWMENGTGDGEVQPFANGVWADAAGTLRFDKAAATAVLASIPKQAPKEVGDVRNTSKLRYVSLPRLEATIRNLQQQRVALPEEMLTLAGLQRVQYIFVAPATDTQPGDLVAAGPAGDWLVRPDGKIVSTDTGQPIVRLDDLLTLWRRQEQLRGAAFGVSINPRQANLAKVQDYVRITNAEPIEPSERGKWLEGLQQSLGKQDIEFFGIKPNSHVARVLLVADYHMKLIGMGIADGVEGVRSYLSTVKLDANGNLPPMTVLRWWFAMEYEPVTTTAERDVFQLRGLGAKVLSENELLAARGQRVHTGQSKDLNKQYADSFSKHFEQICQKYPVYGELRNVFDLSMTLALIRSEGLLDRIGWRPELFANPSRLPLPQMLVPKEVDTVVSHRVIRRKHIVAGISGGVWVDAKKVLKVNVSADKLAAPKAAPGEQVWWWD